MIDIIIPTMWHPSDFIDTLKKYTEYDCVNKIIVIDNNKSKRPNSDVLFNDKIQIVSYGRNLYVNPSWNEGYYRATTDTIAIINDDVSVEQSVFDMIFDFDLKVGDLVGVNLRGYQNNFKIDDHIDTAEEIVKINYDKSKPIGGQAWAFGICMFMRKETYSIIPSVYKIWYGDDYIAQRCNNVYAINSNKIKGKISETIVKYDDPKSDISKRIKLDSKNFIRFNHFKKSSAWDLPYQIAKEDVDVFKEEYEKAKNTPSDINENLHILYDLAKECKTVIEMGVRTGVSSRAFLYADVSLLSFDIQFNKQVKSLFDVAISKGKSVQYVTADVLNIEIEETDLLFIDTLHTYGQLKQELKLHGNKAKKYLVFHDTFTFGLTGELNKSIGLLPAIIEFMIENPHWKFKLNVVNNNGLTVLERIK